MKKRWIVLLAALLVLTLAMTACRGDDDDGPGAVTETPAPATPTPAPATPTPAPAVVAPPAVTAQTHLEILVGAIAVSMSPIGSNDSASAEFSRLVYQTLFRLDYDTFEPVMELATSFSFVDAQTVNISVREGVTFHNGDPLTAHDVAFSLTAAGNSVEMAIIFDVIDRAVAHNDTDLTLYLNIPFAPIIAHLAHPGGSIVPMNLIETIGWDEFAQNPIGSGPWMLREFVPGSHYDLVRFEGYTGNMPALETIRFRVVPDASIRLIEVSSGTADVAIAIAPADIVGAEADPDVTLMRQPSMGIDIIWMNTQRPYLNNPLVRQAINYAFDTEAVVNLVFLGAGTVNHTALPHGAWGRVEQPPFTTDINRARELLTEAGYYPGGFSIEVWWNTPNAQRQQIAEMMQHALSPLNINVEVVTMEWGEYLERSGAGEHDMLILGWTTVTGDADYGLYPLFHSSNFGPPGNRGFLYHPELDRLLEEGRAEVNPVARAAIYAEILAILRQEAPIVMLRSGEALVAVNPNMRNMRLNPTLSHNWSTVYFVD